MQILDKAFVSCLEDMTRLSYPYFLLYLRLPRYDFPGVPLNRTDLILPVLVVLSSIARPELPRLRFVARPFLGIFEALGCDTLLCDILLCDILFVCHTQETQVSRHGPDFWKWATYLFFSCSNTGLERYTDFASAS